jgi:Sulfotransferase family
MGTMLNQTERRLVWILGSPRSGSTWLMNLLGFGGAGRINEPAIGAHLGVMLGSFLPIEPCGNPVDYRLDQFRAQSGSDEDYFFSARWEEVWRPALRSLILRRFQAQLGQHRYVIVKEPHGSQAAELLMSTLPRARLIFLLRDGRDVVDSILDATAPNSWLMRFLEGFRAMNRETSIRTQAYAWLWRTQAVQRAFEAHGDGLKMLVRYEELRAHPTPVLTSLANWLGLNVERITKVAEATAVERLPSHAVGQGEFIRTATPGQWRENLSAQEQDMVHEIIGAKLLELGYPVP